LKQVAQCFGSFSIKTTYSETQLVDRFDDLIDLLAKDESRKMEHGRGAHSRTDVGGAGGEVTEGGGEGKFEFILQGGIEFVGCFPSFEQVEARAKGLEADMIFFIDHDGKGLVSIYHQATACIFGGMLATDEMFFDKELLIERGQSFHGDRNFGWAHAGEVGDGWLNRFEKFETVRFFEPSREGEIFDVSGEADATCDHNPWISFRGRRGGGVPIFRFHRF